MMTNAGEERGTEQVMKSDPAFMPAQEREWMGRVTPDSTAGQAAKGRRIVRGRCNDRHTFGKRRKLAHGVIGPRDAVAVAHVGVRHPVRAVEDRGIDHFNFH